MRTRRQKRRVPGRITRVSQLSMLIAQPGPETAINDSNQAVLSDVVRVEADGPFPPYLGRFTSVEERSEENANPLATEDECASGGDQKPAIARKNKVVDEWLEALKGELEGKALVPIDRFNELAEMCAARESEVEVWMRSLVQREKELELREGKGNKFGPGCATFDVDVRAKGGDTPSLEEAVEHRGSPNEDMKEESTETITELEARVEQEETKSSGLEADLNDALRKLKESLDGMERQREWAEELERRLEERESEVLHLVRKRNAGALELEEQLADRGTEITTLEGKLTTCQKQQEELSATVERSSMQAKSSQEEEAAKHKEDAGIHETQLRDLRTELNRCHDTAEQLKRRLAETEEDHEKRTQKLLLEIDGYREEATKKNERATRAEAGLRNLRSRLQYWRAIFGWAIENFQNWRGISSSHRLGHGDEYLTYGSGSSESSTTSSSALVAAGQAQDGPYRCSPPPRPQFIRMSFPSTDSAPQQPEKRAEDPWAPDASL